MTPRTLYLPTPEYQRRRWRVVWRPMSTAHGLCDHAARTITIATNQTAADAQSTIRHEIIHAVRGYEEHHVEAGEIAANAAEALIQRYWPED